MVNRFTLNKETYTAKPFTFKLLVDLNKMGIKIADMSKMDMALLNAYVAVCVDVDEDEAAELIEKHVIGGGKLEELIEVMSAEMEESDFFRALMEQAETRTGENLPKSGEDSETDRPKRGRKPNAE